MAGGEDALICDMAEVYRIYDLRALPVKTLAALACGLGPDSRSKMRLAGAKCHQETLLLAVIADRLGLILWGLTEDGQKGRNRPASIAAALMGDGPESGKDGGAESFATPEDFQRAWKQMTEGAE